MAIIILRRHKIDIIPAIDIRGGKCVSLYQGDYNDETVFSEDPVDAALKWQSFGATRLHIVDLDGAAAGELVNLDIITRIGKGMLVPTQVGGGIRSIESIEQLLKAGVDRVILSTSAVEDPRLLKEACRRFSESIIVSIDVREGMVAIRGWQEETILEATEFAEMMLEHGVKRFIHTDISRGSTLTEPNFTAIADIIKFTRRPVIAAGGISSILHLQMLKQLGAEGAIVGKALYTGAINLKQALAAIE